LHDAGVGAARLLRAGLLLRRFLRRTRFGLAVARLGIARAVWCAGMSGLSGVVLPLVARLAVTRAAGARVAGVLPVIGLGITVVGRGGSGRGLVGRTGYGIAGELMESVVVVLRGVEGVTPAPVR